VIESDKYKIDLSDETVGKVRILEKEPWHPEKARMRLAQ
jgi:hypothetical protein